MGNESSVKDQIDEMLGKLRAEPEPEPAAAEPPPVEDKTEPEPAAEPVEEPQEVEEPQAEPEPEPEAEPEPEPEPAPAVDELASTKAEVADLKRKLEELTSQPKPQEPPKEEPEPQFVGEDEDVDLVMQNPKEFNKILGKVHKSARESAVSAVMKDLPDAVRKNLEVIQSVKNKTDDFYKKNPELQPFKKAVAEVYDEVSKAHSDWEVDKLLKEVGTEAKKRLNLGGRTPSGDRRPTPKPNLPPGSKGAKRSVEKPKVDPMVAEIEKMNATR